MMEISVLCIFEGEGEDRMEIRVSYPKSISDRDDIRDGEVKSAFVSPSDSGAGFPLAFRQPV